tara:strand:+ start:539 stop:1741 length:1203 start_codon:yes stop_codon:yes gene_type:complete
MKTAIVVGAGLSGLSCALELEKNGYQVQILEKEDHSGGRVHSDIIEGYILNRGFQVLQTGYPEAKKLLDYKKLELCNLDSEVWIMKNNKIKKLYDPIQNPFNLLKASFSNVGTFWDKLRLLKIRQSTVSRSTDTIFKDNEITSFEQLQNYGFSDSIINEFFKPLFGGAFLDNELNTTSRMLNFVYKIFSIAPVAIPKYGMKSIPEQLEAKLESKISFNTKVIKLDNKNVFLENETLSADVIVLAANHNSTKQLIPSIEEISWNSTSCYYFIADYPPFNSKVVLLNGNNQGKINNVFVPTNVSKDYSPNNKSIISVSTIGLNTNETEIRNELKNWFGNQTEDWKLLHVYHIEHALPRMSVPGISHSQYVNGIHMCGDYLTSSSINGSMYSGRITAKQIISN